MQLERKAPNGRLQTKGYDASYLGDHLCVIALEKWSHEKVMQGGGDPGIWRLAQQKNEQS